VKRVELLKELRGIAREAIALWFDAEEGEVGPLVLNFDQQG